jgi:hypothetical protein
MAKTPNPPNPPNSPLPGAPRRPSPETLKRSPEANATRSRAKGVPQPSGDGAESNRSRYEAIQQAAYQRAERRGFEPGHEMDDWLDAEKEYETSRAGAADKH